MKRVLVTGAAHGIGKTVAQVFAERGAEVVLVDKNAAGVAAARDEIAAAGHLCRAYAVDVTEPESIYAARDRLHDEAGRIDVLINNAGVVFGGPFLEVPLEKHQLTYRVNVEGVVNMTYAFLADLIAAPRGHLVNIASLSGFVGLPRGASYASSKWAVIGFGESIRLELKKLGHRNVDVTTVCPAYVNTGLFDGVKPPRTTSLLEPEVLAGKVVEAVERRKVWVREPLLAKVTPFLKNCLPTPVGDFVGELFGATTTMDTWRGHAAPDKKNREDAGADHRAEEAA